MTLKEAEEKYPMLLVCNFIDLIKLEKYHADWLSAFSDPNVEEELEAIQLIKKSRMGE